MGQILASLVVVMHVLMRGKSEVVTTLTPLEYVYRHVIRLDNGDERYIVFRCRQHRHVVKYAKWYMVDRVYYTYAVEMINVDGLAFNDYHIAHYPHVCAKWLHRSRYPHRCAINAHLDALRACNQR